MWRHHDNLAVAVITACLLPAGALAAERPNFTGEWSLNVARSDFVQMAAPIKSVMRIDHKDPSLKIVTTTVSERGERTTEAAYATDGKETVNRMFRDSEVKCEARWESPALLIEIRGTVNGDEFLITEKWTLAAGGRTLTILRTAETWQGPITTTRVLEKQQPAVEMHPKGASQ